MRAPLFKRAVAVAATLCAALAPSLLARPALAADVAGPATCYLADENDNILEPRRQYVPNDGAGEIPVHPSPVVPGQYTLEISAPALNFEPRVWLPNNPPRSDVYRSFALAVSTPAISRR